MTDAPEAPEPITKPNAEAALAAHGTNPWAINDFRLIWLGRLAAVLAIQIQSSALLWQVYEIARRDHPIEQASLYLGLVGLAQFIPLLLLTLPAGEMADRRDRRGTVILAILAEGTCALSFLAMAIHGNPPLWGLLAVAVGFGASRAFLAPASQAYLPMVVGRAALPRAIAAQSIAFQTGAIAGPALGGVIVGVNVPLAYAVSLAMFAVGLICFLVIKTSGKPTQVEAAGDRWEAVKDGLKYVWSTKIVLGAISLDLIVVLFAGVALLTPIFARDILHVGPEGFGLLRASFGVGAFMMALILARYPIPGRGGMLMFASVAVFGICTIVFGLSKVVWISAAALFIGGAADMVSVNIRQTLIQLSTPDHMRGRVSSVSMLFIGASNELGEAYSGVMVRFLGPIGAAVFGGVGALAATGVWAKLFPGLRKADKLV
ncbi:MAG: MFS transporter [Brevundimonas subvibrioides]|uniref:MFS transporter n=1 Tax=Brevundimonas subvibrioides TaxID=74313 RepID=A0A258HFH0_9CAUL|nr:MFS transporter [Brevundimonas subvibrioides]OYX55731.1 MAG: MFS transporter [Brevundimonas subvibrioides]